MCLAMERQILKHFSSHDKPTNEELNALLKIAKDQQCFSRNHNSKPTWSQEEDLSYKQHSKEPSNSVRLANPHDKLQMMHGQSPYIVPSQISPPFNASNGFLAPTSNSNHHSKEPPMSFDLRCFVCGASCATFPDLNQHLKQHIPSISNHESQRANIEKNEANKTSFHKKSWSDSSSHSSDIDATSTNFPIPIPNFALFNESMSPSASNMPAKEKGPSTEGVVPPLGFSLPLNPALYPAFPAAFGLLNPLLNYQNLINSKGFGQSASLPGLSVPPYGYLPYIGAISSSPSANLVPVPGRFPYFPGLPIGMPSSVPQDSAVPSPTLRSDSNQPADAPTTSDVNNGAFSTSHSDALQRRLSVPLIGHSNEFRVPHPYTRIRKPSHNNVGHNPTTNEKVEATNEQHGQQYRNSHVSNKKRLPVEDKSSNQLNAKSIEQHISKLISNNEKLLTNPELERVKPRRVFRRNSLDPSSLSSYATGMSKYNSRDPSYYRESTLKPRRMLSESDNTSRHPSSNSNPLESYDSYTSSLSLAEFNNMIQLTRAPYNAAEKHSASNAKLSERVTNVSGPSTEPLNISGRDVPHSKRDFSQTYSQPHKKSRRSSFFECNDCGVRYRKEENYKIHKEVYCKFKKNSSFKAKEKLRRHSDLPDLPPNNRGPTFSIDPAASSALPRFELTRPPNALVSNFPSANNGPTYSPGKNTRPDLCRTKSAEASLESNPGHDNKWKKPTDSSFTTSPTTHLRTPLSDTPAPEILPSPTSSPSQPSVNNSIPTSKLPPNKRHLMQRHLEAGSPPTLSTHSDVPTLPPNHVSASTSDVAHERLPSEAPGENRLDESLIPRSNYKLLVHQISLRNMQDIDLMSDLSANLLQNKSVWSWEQIQGLKHNKLQEDCRGDQSPQGMPPSLRKFSVPSRLLPDTDAVASSSPHSTDHSHNTIPPGPFIHRPATSVPSVEKDLYSAPVSSVAPIRPDSLHNSLPTNCTWTSAGKGSYRNQTVSSSQEQSQSETTSDDSRNDVKVSSCEEMRLSSVSEPAAIASDADKQFAENGKVNESKKAVVLYPHTEPVLDSGACVSFCCMVSPQPACIETSKPPDKKSAHLSMYSEWAISEPFLVPKDLTIGDILNGWCQCRGVCRRGVVTCMSSHPDMLLTDNKAYEKLQEKSDKDAKDEPDIAVDDTPVSTSEPYKVAELAGLLSNSVYTSCCHKHVNHSFPFHPMPPISKTSTLHHVTSSSSSKSDTGIAMMSQTGDDDVMVEESLSSPPSDMTDARLASTEEDSGDVNKESDSTDARMDLSGRVKRRRSRRNRSSTSPREKRKAAGGSPTSPTPVLPVHQDGGCSGSSDDNRQDCALCNMKAGKSGSTQADSSGSKSPQPVVPSALKFAPTSSPNTPAVTGAVLDRTRGVSGNTQHWVSDVSHLDPPPVSNSPTSSSSEAHPDAPCPPPSQGDGVERTSAVVSSSLAEVVSEVMRSAAMQSKMHNKRRQLLSGSRALLPGDEDDEGPSAKRRNIHGVQAPRADDSHHSMSNSRQCTASPAGESVQTRIGPSSESGTNESSPGACATESNPAPNQLATSSMERSGQQLSGQDDGDESHVSDPINSAQHGSVASSHDTNSAHHESASSGHEDEDSDGRYDKTDGPPCSPGVARPFCCSECKIAFRIGGHLAKHLRSKGHILAVQKKTLNRFKLSQIQRLTSGVGAESEASLHEEKRIMSDQQPVIAHQSNGSASDPEGSEILTGSDVLGRAQVRALLEGNDEYACVPVAEQIRQCEMSDESCPTHQDPRPYKCIACKVAFRFQGHLDRHFRSNSHLIAVGHYEHNPFAIFNMTSLSDRPLLYGNDMERSVSRDSDTATSSEPFNDVQKLDEGGSGKEDGRPAAPNGVCSFSPIRSDRAGANESHDSSKNSTSLEAASQLDRLEAASQLNGSSENRSNPTLLAHKHITPPLPCQVSCT